MFKSGHRTQSMYPDFEEPLMCVWGTVKLQSLIPSHEEISSIEVNLIIPYTLCTLSFINKQGLQDFGLVYMGYFYTTLLSCPVKVPGQECIASVQISLVMSSYRYVLKVSERWNIWESQPSQKLLLQCLLRGLHPTYQLKHSFLARAALP